MFKRLKGLKFLVTGATWKKRTITGITLMMLGTIAFPVWWLVDGYALMLMRRAQRAEPLDLPEWKNWSDLFREGVYVNVIRLVYGLPLVGLGLALALLAALGTLSVLRNIGPDATLAQPFFAVGSSLTVIVVGSIIAVPISLFISYITPLGALRYAQSGRLDDAFRIVKIFQMMTRAPVAYTIAFLVARTILFTGVLIGGLASGTGILAPVGFAIVAIFGYFAEVVTFVVYGMAYAHADEYQRQRAVQIEDAEDSVLVLEENPFS